MGNFLLKESEYMQRVFSRYDLCWVAATEPLTNMPGTIIFMPENKTNWTQLMMGCLSAFLREQGGSSCSVVDYELRSGLKDSPDDMRVWFICRTKGEKDGFISTERSRSISVFKGKMIAAGFSDSAVASVEIKIMSRDEIEKAGGSSAFFQ